MSVRVRPPNPQYLDFLSAYDPHVVELALATRALVLEEAPDAIELIYDAYSAVSAGYGFTGRPSESFVYVAAYTSAVNLGFWRGASFPDPRRVLQGTGKQSRHIKIATLSDLEKPAVREFLRMAIAQAARPVGEEPKRKSMVRAVYEKKRRPKPSRNS